MSQRISRDRYVVRKMMQTVWRVQRSLTLGAQGIVIDGDGRVLLVRHSYKPGWCFPGGGVEKGETVMTALARELDEEAGVALAGTPEIMGIYSNKNYFPNDHIVLFIVRAWTRLRVPAPNNEIVEHAFFDPRAPIADCAPATERRLAELFRGAPRDEYW